MSNPDVIDGSKLRNNQTSRPDEMEVALLGELTAPLGDSDMSLFLFPGFIDG